MGAELALIANEEFIEPVVYEWLCSVCGNETVPHKGDACSNCKYPEAG